MLDNIIGILSLAWARGSFSHTFLQLQISKTVYGPGQHHLWKLAAALSSVTSSNRTFLELLNPVIVTILFKLTSNVSACVNFPLVINGEHYVCYK